MRKMKILFVCLGNICRSPMAETIFQAKVKEMGLSEKIQIDSAGTSGFHSGERADSRMRMHAEKHGYTITSRSRKVGGADFADFDKVIAMDDSNVANLQKICPLEHLAKISKMTDYLREYSYSEIPDPYYGGDKGFSLVIALLEDASEGLLEKIKDEI